MAFKIEHCAKLSSQDFREQYLFQNKPVIITDAINKWKALSRWTPEFFKTQFSDIRISINSKEQGQADYGAKGHREFTMAQFIDLVLCSTDETPAPYFRNGSLYELFPDLKADIDPLPPYFFPNWLSEPYLMRNVQQVFNRGSQIEIYIGGKGGAFPVLHYDGLASHAFLAQIYGRKKFILYSPEQEQYLYPSPEKTNVTLIADIEKPNLQKCPLFAKAEPTTFVLEPGELLFIPSRWWHTTKMLTACISVSVNVVNESNWTALTDFVSEKRKPLLRIPSRIYLNWAGSWRSRRDRRLAAWR